jgi:hypothetical protein
MECYIRAMTLDRYNELMALWGSPEGLWSSDDDDYDGLPRFIQRNPGLNLFANGIGRKLVEKCVQNLHN